MTPEMVEYYRAMLLVGFGINSMRPLTLLWKQKNRYLI